MTTRWDPSQYDRFKAERERPAHDLMARIPADFAATEVWDLGCGAGEHALSLLERWPDARVHGLDSSPDMLARARALTDRIEWVEGDFETWSPPRPPDLIFTNAALHWASDHDRLFPRLAGALAPGGLFACQVPQSYDAPWHRLLRETAADGPWAERLSTAAGVRPVAEPEQYYDWLRPVCADVDIWTTTYLHRLQGDDPVVEWMKGTGLRPFLQALASDAERDAFLDAYRRRLSGVFRPRPDGTTLFPFPRLFVTARRS